MNLFKRFKRNSPGYLRLEKEFRNKQSWLFKKPPKVIIKKNIPPILIYQMGKVGSTSIKFTFQKNKLPNPVYHVHQLTDEGIEWNLRKNRLHWLENRENDRLDDHTRMYTELYLEYVIRDYENYKLLRKKIDRNLHRIPWKIITLVRDPIMREFSNFFFSFHERPGLIDKNGELLKDESLQALKDQVTHAFQGSKSWVLTWFDEELKKVFGVDVYDYPFDHEKGYIIIHHDNIEILILKLEELSRSFTPAIFEFIGRKIENLINVNTAGQKQYYQIYRYALENISFDYDFCRKIYDSKFSRHFYTESEREEFISKWTKKP